MVEHLDGAPLSSMTVRAHAAYAALAARVRRRAGHDPDRRPVRPDPPARPRTARRLRQRRVLLRRRRPRPRLGRLGRRRCVRAAATRVAGRAHLQRGPGRPWVRLVRTRRGPVRLPGRAVAGGLPRRLARAELGRPWRPAAGRSRCRGARPTPSRGSPRRPPSSPARRPARRRADAGCRRQPAGRAAARARSASRRRRRAVPAHGELHEQAGHRRACTSPPPSGARAGEELLGWLSEQA